MTSTTADRLAGVTASLASKAPVRAATTANITLSGEQTIDSVAVVADDRVLVKDQTDGIENGVYDAKSGAWVRSLDFDGTRDVKSGTFVVVASGTAGAGTLWRISTADDITIGTTSIAFALMTVDSASPFMLTVLDDATAAAARTTLGAIASLAEDATPQLGGPLDANSQPIRFSKGADIASASPLVIGTDGNYFDVTGTTGFSAITVAAGTWFALQFDGALTMTHGASLDLPGEANITTAAGDRLIGYAEAADTVQVLAYFRADGSLYAGVATQAEMETATSLVKSVPPGRVQNHPGVSKIFAYVDRSAGTPSLSSPSHNVTSVTDDGAAQTIVTIATDMSSVVYAPGAQAVIEDSHFAAVHTLAAGSFKVKLFNEAGSTIDTNDFSCWALGDQA